MRVVITGGSGYIGARLSAYLSDKGFEVIPVCFSSIPEDQNWKSKMFGIYQLDLRKEETTSFITSLKPDAIIHLVSLDHTASENDSQLAQDTNVLPTLRLLDSCTKAGLKKFIYFSTIHVYGKLENSIVTESHAAKTENTYGLTHYLSESICDYYNRKTATNVISVRLSNSYGAPVLLTNNCWSLAVNDLCKQAFQNKEIRLLSDGSPQRDFIHGNDVCDAIEKLLNLNSKNIENNIYHISSGQTITLLELAKTVRDAYQSRYGQLLEISISNGNISVDTIQNPKERYTISNEKLMKLRFFTSYNSSLPLGLRKANEKRR